MAQVAPSDPPVLDAPAAVPAFDPAPAPDPPARDALPPTSDDNPPAPHTPQQHFPADHTPPPPPPPPLIPPMVAAFADLSLAPPPPYTPQPQLPMLPIQPVPLVTRHALPHTHHHPAVAAHLLQQQHHAAHTYYMWVPQERVGAVIGGHGAVIRSLQERSGATIQVHNDTVRGDLKLFTIFGTLAQYEVAKQLITEIIDKPRHSHPSQPSTPADRVVPFAEHAPSTPRPPELCKTVYVPTSCVGLVIGRNGETIRSLQDRSGAEIKVTPDEEATPGAETRSILISGTEDAISSAHQLVSEIVMDARSRRPPHPAQQVGVSLNGQPLVLEVLSVPNEKVGLIIGKKGAAIRDLQLKSGAKIQVTKDDSSVQSDGTRPVTITGMRANVDNAKTMIASKINVPMLQSSTISTNYSNSPQQVPSTVSTPSASSQHVPYLVPNLYEPAYQNGQQPFQQMYDSNDPNAQNRAMAYFQFIGYNNYNAMAQQQQRQYQSQISMHYPHPQQQQQQPQQVPEDPQQQQQTPLRAQQQEQQDSHIGLPPQQHSPQAQQSSPQPQQQQQQPLVTSQQMSQQQQQQQQGPPAHDGMQGSPGMVPRDPNGNVLMFPGHAYQQLPHQLGGHQMYASGPPNSRMFSRREQVQAAHAQAQAQAHMLMQAQAQAAHAQAQAQSQAQNAQAQQAQAHAQVQLSSQAEAEGLTETQTLQQVQPTSVSTGLEESEQPNG